MSNKTKPHERVHDAPASEVRKIVLVGASVRAAAQSARRRGYHVIGIDLFGDADTLAACHCHFLIGSPHHPRAPDPGDVIRACRGLPIIQVGGLASDHPLVAALFPTQASFQRSNWDQRLEFPARLTAEQLRDPGIVREIALQAGMRFPSTDEAPNLAASERLIGTRRWLWKQHDGCGGLGVRWRPAQNPETSSSVGDDGPTGHFQQWVAGRAFGATLLSDGTSGRLLGVCRALFTRMPGLPFVYAGSLGPINVSSREADSLGRVAEEVAKSTSLRGVFNVDYIRDRSGSLWMLEINPRWSGSMELIERRLMEQSRIDSLLGVSVEASRNRLPVNQLDLLRFHPDDHDAIYLKRILFARTRSRFERTALESLLSEQETIHDIPFEGSVIQRGQPVCTIIRRIEPNADEKDPMRRHRVLMKRLHAAIKDRCA